jgi:hypothetical protein
VKNLKFGVLLFGVLGVVSLLILGIIPDGFKEDAVNSILVLAGFAVPAVVAAMGAAKPPFQRWQAAVAVAGFALVFVKMRMWVIAPHIMDLPGAGFKLMIISTILGLIVSIIALVKSEEA